MSEEKTKSCNHIKSPLDCLNVKMDPNDPASRECAFFLNQFLEEEQKACHHETCDVEAHKKAKRESD